MKKHFTIIIALVIIASIGTTLLVLKRSDTPADPQPAEKALPVVDIENVSSLRAISSDFSATGTIRNESEAAIVASVSGTIVSAPLELGRFVGTGQTLFRIDTPGSGIAPESGFQSSGLQIAELALKNAEKDYQEAKRSDDNEETMASETAKDQARNSRDMAKISYQALLDQYIVKSPITGTIAVKNVSVGDTVSVGDALATVSRGKKIVRFYVNDSEQALLSIGHPISFSKDISGKNALPGKIVRISPIADTDSRRFLIEAESQADEFSRLSSGTVVSIFVFVSRHSASDTFFLPLSALSQDQDGSAIFIFDNGRSKRTPAEIRDIQGEFVELSSAGFADDTFIITTDIKRLKDGDAVTLKQ